MCWIHFSLHMMDKCGTNDILLSLAWMKGLFCSCVKWKITWNGWMSVWMSVWMSAVLTQQLLSKLVEFRRRQSHEMHTLLNHICGKHYTIAGKWWLKSHLKGQHLVAAFSSLARTWGECSTIYPQPVLFFFLVEISSCTLNPLFRPGSVHSGSVNWDDCGWEFPDELCVSLFPDRFPHYAWTAA